MGTLCHPEFASTGTMCFVGVAKGDLPFQATRLLLQTMCGCNSLKSPGTGKSGGGWAEWGREGEERGRNQEKGVEAENRVASVTTALVISCPLSWPHSTFPGPLV